MSMYGSYGYGSYGFGNGHPTTPSEPAPSSPPIYQTLAPGLYPRVPAMMPLAPLPPAAAPPAPVPVTPAEGEAAPLEKPGLMDRAKTWWAERSGTEKGAIVVGGVAVVGLLVWALAGRGMRPNYTPNLRRAERRAIKKARPGRAVRVGKRRYKAGKILTIKGGRRFGHKIPPKRYRAQGAIHPQDYAWPQGYVYPLVFHDRKGKIKPALSRARTRAAARYFGKNKHLYPATVRRTIARRINAAKDRFGIGGTPATA
jgi:hypothetical protein